MLAAIKSFGFESLGLTEQDLLAPEQIVQLGVPPKRIDIATTISGIEDEAIWERRIPDEWDGIKVWWIDRASLIKNKRSVRRPKDLADLDVLGDA